MPGGLGEELRQYGSLSRPSSPSIDVPQPGSSPSSLISPPSTPTKNGISPWSGHLNLLSTSPISPSNYNFGVTNLQLRFVKSVAREIVFSRSPAICSETIRRELERDIKVWMNEIDRTSIHIEVILATQDPLSRVAEYTLLESWSLTKSENAWPPSEVIGLEMDDTERLEQVLRSLRCCIRETTLGRWLEANPHIDLQYGALDTSTFELDDTDAHRETFPDFQCNDGVFSVTALLNKQLDDIDDFCLDSYQLYIVPSYSTAPQSPSRNCPPFHSLKNSISPLSLSPTHKNRTSPVSIPSFRSLSLSDTSTPISTSSSPTRTVSPRSHSPVSSTTSPCSITHPPSHPPSLTSALGICSRRDPALFPRYPSPVVMRRNSFSPPDHHSYSSSSASSHFLSRSPSSELSFVGSFEESILSGRMSHTPATQFRGFVADLGVCCKNFAPSHLRIPFDAVCYRLMETSPSPRGGSLGSIGNGGGGNSEEEIGAGMSLIPYVGSIDLEDKKYRIPPSGIIQLTIFNPSKTPIKTFLIKYDVHDMPPLTKTFIRQRICSTAPTPSPSPSPSPSHSTLSPSSVFLLSASTSRSSSSSSSSVSLADSTGVPLITTSPPKLQYAVHLRIKSPRKKKFYLYRNIRVVFPHRVPDESCNLKTFYDLPDQPRYYPYSPEELQS